MPFTVIIPPNVTQPQAEIIPDATETDAGVITLTGQTFTDAILVNATLINALLDDPVLNNAILNNPILFNAVLDAATLNNAILNNAVSNNETLNTPTLVDPSVTGWLKLASFSDASRPAANTVPAGGMIFNTDDKCPNISDSLVWRDMDGEET